MFVPVIKSIWETFFFGKYCNFVLNGKKKKPNDNSLNHSNHYTCHILVWDTLLMYSSLFHAFKSVSQRHDCVKRKRGNM